MKFKVFFAEKLFDAIIVTGRNSSEIEKFLTNEDYYVKMTDGGCWFSNIITKEIIFNGIFRPSKCLIIGDILIKFRDKLICGYSPNFFKKQKFKYKDELSLDVSHIPNDYNLPSYNIVRDDG